MKYLLLSVLCILPYNIQALEYEIQFENEFVNIAHAKIMPHEEIGLHRDEYPQVVIAIQGGVITRLEADGSTTDVNFPTGKAVRKIDPPDQLHKSVNNSSAPVELIIIQLRNILN